MRRPVFCVLLAFAGGIMLAFYFPELWPFCGVLGGLLPVLFRKKSFLWVLVTAVLLGGLSFWAADSFEGKLSPHAGSRGEFSGRILSAEAEEDFLSLVVRVNSFREGSSEVFLREKVLVRCYEEDLIAGKEPGWSQDLIGREAVFSGEIQLPSPRRNPNLFDYGLYLKTKGIRARVTAEDLQISEDVPGKAAHGLGRIRGKFIREICSTLDEESGGLLIGMVFGDRSFLSEEVYGRFQQNGTAHILAVSGIHVGAVYLFVRRLTGGSKGLISRILSLALLWFYAALAAFSPSVVRAAIMITVHIFGEILLRRYDLLCGASAAALMMLVKNPFQLFDVGFQLSFTAVFSLAFLLPHMDRGGDRLRQWMKVRNFPGQRIFTGIAGSMAPLFAIQLGMIPIMAFHFLSVSPGAFFLNPPTLFLAGILIPLGIVLIPAAFLGGPVFGIPAVAGGILAQGMICLNDLLYIPGLSAFMIQAPSMIFLILYYGSLFFLSSETRRLWGLHFLPLLLAVLLAVGLLFSLASGEWKGRAALSFPDVGQGDCLLIQSPSGRNITIDGGGSAVYDVGTEILMPYMRKNGIRQIDLALVTHLHDDHYLGIASLAEQFPVLRMEMELKKGDRIFVEENVWIDILYPEEVFLRDENFAGEEENETCLLMKVFYDGVTVLMTGDMGFEQEEAVLELYAEDPGILKSDILKVGHHGSKYSTSDAFLAAVDPDAAVIQVGKNNFGHPHEDVIEKLEENDIMIYRNDLDGAIFVKIKNGEYRIETML